MLRGCMANKRQSAPRDVELSVLFSRVYVTRFILGFRCAQVLFLHEIKTIDDGGNDAQRQRQQPLSV